MVKIVEGLHFGDHKFGFRWRQCRTTTQSPLRLLDEGSRGEGILGHASRKSYVVTWGTLRFRAQRRWRFNYEWSYIESGSIFNAQLLNPCLVHGWTICTCSGGIALLPSMSNTRMGAPGIGLKPIRGCRMLLMSIVDVLSLWT